MTLRSGRWRYRIRVRRCDDSAMFADCTRLPEGIVYRLRFALWLVIVLADCQSEHERTVRAQEARSAWATMEAVAGEATKS